MDDEPRHVKPNSAEQIVFAEALLFPDIDARAAYLDEACATDALRRRVEALLRAAANAGDFLENPPAGLAEESDSMSLTGDLNEHAGDRIGHYKLLEKIGEGGCGVVYMAEQEEPVRRRVALKVIKLGMDTRQVVARFEAERQALALMDHPNIAKVFDGGATPHGRPYFVMELVRGMCITEFCDEAGLPIEARLRLFVQVCQAVQHAHQKGVIHRDIKPSNILVTLNDGAPVPKVIDFGIAKATGQRLTDKTVFTQFHSFIGTPAYTSPEQAEMSSVDVDTRSDIYSLGVLLYELLTGKTPFDGEELMRSGLDEMRKTIREKEPVRPSTRLAQELAGSGQSRIESRNIPKEQAQFSSRPLQPTRQLISTVRGDLDWIVMRCLEKDRGSRYETAAGLAADIQRHLDHEPVTARSPSGMYLLQKLAQRNRGALITAATVFALLLVAVFALAASNTRIRQERNQKNSALVERSAALEVARRSERYARKELLASLQSQAQARRKSGQMGQRLESLAVLSEAASIQPSPELRDNAIAAMAMPDLFRDPNWPGLSADKRSVKFDANFQRYSLISSNGQISIRSLPDHRELQKMELGSATSTGLDWSHRMEFSQDGQYLAGIEEEFHLRVWRLPGGESVLEDAMEKCSAAAFSPNGRQIAVGDAEWIRCLDLFSGRETRRWKIPKSVYMLAFNPDNRRLAVSYLTADIVSIYDSQDGICLANLQVGPSDLEIVAWHPDGQLLAAAGSNPRIQIWNVETQRKVSELDGHAEQVTGMQFHPGGELLASSSWDGVLRLWHPCPGRLLMRLAWPAELGFSPDGRWAGISWLGNDHPQLWGIEPSREYHTFLQTFEGDSVIFEGDLSPDGRLLALAGSYGVRLWDVASGREVGWLPIKQTISAMFRADGQELLTCGTADGLQRWPITGDPHSKIGIQIGPPHAVPLPWAPTRMARSRGGLTLAIVGENAGQALVLDLVTESVRLQEMPHDQAGFVALSSGGERLATSGWHSDQVKVWDGRNGKLLNTLKTGLISRVYFTPDGRELIVARDREFTFHDLKTMEVDRRLAREIGLYPGHVAFTANDSLMALEMAPGVIHLMAVQSGRLVAKLEDPTGDVSTWLGFTPDGTQLIVAARYASVIHRWDLRAIRERLKNMNLDWDWPEFPPAAPTGTQPQKAHGPVRVQVISSRPAAAGLSSAPASSRTSP